MPDKKSCGDVDECTISDYPCAQKCVNNIGSFECSCHSGFALRPDKMSCKSLYDPKYIIYTVHNTIYKLQPHLEVLWQSNTSSAILDININYDRNLLYFTMEDTSALFELNVTSGSIHVAENIGKPSDIAVDWISNNVYIIDDSTEPSIHICHMGDLTCITLKTFKQRDRLKTIAVDPINKRLVYSVLNFIVFYTPESNIFVENLDGSQSKQLALNGVHRISAIDLDFYSKRIYFLDQERHSLWSINYDGTDKREIINKNKNIVHPIDISLFENHATILSRASNVVVQCQLYAKKECKTFQLNFNNPRNLMIVQKTRQKDNENVCENVNCSSICVAAGVGPKCLCGYGAFVGPNRACDVSTNIWFIVCLFYLHLLFFYNDFFQQNELNIAPKFRLHQPEASNLNTVATSDSFEGVAGTVALLFLLVVIVMGSIFAYKRKLYQKKFNVSMHFQNPRSTYDAAKVKICQIPEMVSRTARLNEIFVSKNTTGKGVRLFFYLL